MDRILGESRTVAVPNTTLLMITGNNVVPVGDLNRRVLRCRIDSNEERPHKRAFDFDPYDTIRRNRAGYAVDACTILAAYHAAGAPRLAADRLGGFEAWSDTVRQSILWLASIGLGDAPGGFRVADPSDSIEAGFANDPDRAKLAALLSTWHAAFGSKPVRIADAIAKAEAEESQDMRAALDEAGGSRLLAAMDEIAGHGGRINRRILGRWIERHKARPVGDLMFFRKEDTHAKQALWGVQKRQSAGTRGDTRVIPSPLIASVSDSYIEMVGDFPQLPAITRNLVTEDDLC
ncbi:MAG: hypothetical protein ACT4PZ_15070 [Panacagrimonas sp.]